MPSLLPPMSEKDLQDQAIQLAIYYGWRVTHFRAARTLRGWVTPLQGHKGFPDTVFAHEGRQRTIFAELKSEKGKLRPEQEVWIRVLLAAGQEVHVWRPSDWPLIQSILAGATPAPAALAPSCGDETCAWTRGPK